MDNFAASIIRGFMPFDPAVLLEPVQKSSQSRLFNSHPFGDLFLRKLVTPLRQVHQSPPLALRQPERAEALVESGAPGASGPEEEKAKLVRISGRHTKMVSVLTKCRNGHLSINHLRHDHCSLAIVCQSKNRL